MLWETLHASSTSPYPNSTQTTDRSLKLCIMFALCTLEQQPLPSLKLIHPLHSTIANSSGTQPCVCVSGQNTQEALCLKAQSSAWPLGQVWRFVRKWDNANSSVWSSAIISFRKIERRAFKAFKLNRFQCDMSYHLKLPSVQLFWNFQPNFYLQVHRGPSEDLVPDQL